ncbi:MAG TPA: crossover junction endodeoxyribonuclease RuvC, partial [Thermomicrobiales bacterium]|nr:crossover junction endodeoxyribonuclease RuvC [Thermomicrobiales bacterium]
MPSTKPITLGIDPGTAILGYGVIAGDRQPELVDVGVLETSNDLPMPERLLRLHEGLQELFARFQPD